MAQYIEKAAVIAEIERIKGNADRRGAIGKVTAKVICDEILSFLDNLEVKEIDTWHLQEKENIYDAVKGWNLQTFECVMKDRTIQKFTGYMDEDYEGNVGVYIDGANDDYDNVDDIIEWREITT